MLGPERPEAVLPDRVLYLPTFSHLLIVNKLLSLSLSLSLKPHQPEVRMLTFHGRRSVAVAVGSATNISHLPHERKRVVGG